MQPQTTQFDYAALALKRWPRAVVSGSGKYAVRFLHAGQNTVRLFEVFSDAHVFANANHGDYFDLEWYRQQQRPAPRFVRKPDWLRDIETSA